MSIKGRRVSDFFISTGLPNLAKTQELTGGQYKIVNALYKRGFKDLVISSAEEWSDGTKRPGLHGAGKALDFVVEDMSREAHRLFEAFLAMRDRVVSGWFGFGQILDFEWTGGLSLGIRNADRHLHLSVREDGPVYFLETEQPDERGRVKAIIQQQQPEIFKEALKEAANAYGANTEFVQDDSIETKSDGEVYQSMALTGAALGALYGLTRSGFKVASTMDLITVFVPAGMGYVGGSMADKARKEIMEFKLW